MPVVHSEDNLALVRVFRSSSPVGAFAWILLGAPACGQDAPPEPEVATDAFAAAHQASDAAVPAREPTFGPVRIHYDELHVPHVFADTDAGVFRGHGYAQVRDFPVATLSNLWSATGRFAEVAGAAVLARDQRIRQWGIDRRAQELAADPSELASDERACLEAYVDGVNAGRRLWLETPGLIDRLVGMERELAFDPVPLWMHPLRTREDPRARLRRLFEAEVGLEHVLAFGIAFAAGPEFGGGGSSARTNLWMMRGGEKDPHTRMLLDVHQPLQEFGYRTYPVQLAGPRYDVVGLTMPGFPCVVLGASRALAFGQMTLPAKPRELKEAGLAFRLEEYAPLVQGAWSGRLAPDAPARLERGAETLPLVEHAVTLRYHDVERGGLVDDPRGPLTLRWLRDEALGLELPVLEPTPDRALELGAPIRFEARSFQSQHLLWATWLRLALCKGIGNDGIGDEPDAFQALGRDGLAIGRGQACLFADADGDFAHVWSTRAARVGEDVRTRIGELLDGNDPAQRWLGFHGVEDSAPIVGHGLGGVGAAWILCNNSPEFLGPSTGFAHAVSAEVSSGQPWKTRRLERARELFERVNADGIHETAELERMALDVQDQWSRANWPWIEALAAAAEPPLSERARAFVAWLERFRFEGPDGRPGTAEPFLAHRMSQVMPFLVLVRDRSEDELVAARPPADALALAFDPLFPPPAREAYLGEERFEPNRRALRSALEWAAELRERALAGEPGGLERSLFAQLSERWRTGGALFPDAWTPLAAREQAPGWPEAAPPVALRWGEVNVYALTPHRWPGDPPQRNAARAEDWLLALLAPRSSPLELPFLRRQSAVVFPSGGTHDSLFQVHRESFHSYARALIPRGERLLFLAPIDFGSQVLLLLELRGGERPRARIMPALRATEITAALPELELEELAPYSATARFARGEWSELETDEERLRTAPGVRTVVLEH